MQINPSNWKNLSVLDAAIVAGLLFIFIAAAVPLVRGAVLRRQAAECARKIISAADAFDLYAASFGSYPQSQQDSKNTAAVMKGAFAVYDIDWWEETTELGGQWSWYSNGQASSVVISGAGIPEQRMILLDTLLDDGNLETGLFQRRCSRYHYVIKEHRL